MTEWITMFMVNFILVFLKGYQTQVVISGSYLMGFITSVLMGGTIVVNTIFIIDSGWDSLVPLTLGGAFGLVSSMYIYRKQQEKK